MTQRPAQRWSRSEWVVALILVGALRLAVIWLAGERLDQDPDSYRRLGKIWSETGTFGEWSQREAPEPEAVDASSTSATNATTPSSSNASVSGTTASSAPGSNASSSEAQAEPSGSLLESESGASESAGATVSAADPTRIDPTDVDPTDADRARDEQTVLARAGAEVEGEPQAPMGGVVDRRVAATEALAREVRGEMRAVRATAYRPPLYPALLAGLDRFGWLNRAGIGGINWLSGVGSVMLLAYLANAAHGRRTAWLATLLLTIDPLSVLQSTLAMTETLTTFWILLAAILLLKTRLSSRWVWSILAGLVLGLGALTRPPILAWGVAVVGWELLNWAQSRYRWTRVPLPRTDPDQADEVEQPNDLPLGQAARGDWMLVRVLGISLGMFLALAPWGFRNLWLLGEFRVTTTHGGYTLFLANNPSFYRAVREYRDPRDWRADATDFQQALRTAYGGEVREPADELTRDASLSEAAWETIESDRVGFLLSCWTRLNWFWGVSPNLEDSPRARMISLVVAFFYGSVYAVACLSLWTVRRWGYGWRMIGLLVLGLMAIHTIYWSNPRMRTPIAPWVCWTAAACLSLSRGADD